MCNIVEHRYMRSARAWCRGSTRRARRATDLAAEDHHVARARWYLDRCLSGEFQRTPAHLLPAGIDVLARMKKSSTTNAPKWFQEELDWLIAQHVDPLRAKRCY